MFSKLTLTLHVLFALHAGPHLHLSPIDSRDLVELWTTCIMAMPEFPEDCNIHTSGPDDSNTRTSVSLRLDWQSFRDTTVSCMKQERLDA
jgi:hypothetical protein